MTLYRRQYITTAWVHLFYFCKGQLCTINKTHHARIFDKNQFKRRVFVQKLQPSPPVHCINKFNIYFLCIIIVAVMIIVECPIHMIQSSIRHICYYFCILLFIRHTILFLFHFFSCSLMKMTTMKVRKSIVNSVLWPKYFLLLYSLMTWCLCYLFCSDTFLYYFSL